MWFIRGTWATLFYHSQVFWWQPNFRRSHSSTILLYVPSCNSWIYYCLLCRCLGHYTGIYMTLLGHYMGDYYRPQTKLREGYVFTRVSDSVHRGRWYPSMHCRFQGPHPGGGVGWISQHALTQPPNPPSRRLLLWAVCILLNAFLFKLLSV